ncbi:MAG: hypothetical protein A2284_17700 [Deltaproteobacteria bacterium RIFOXYA12_FULL_61_11]|nr:MAG: hypothetical protein A2284_17700 [Deltaproteobacteria bacterium RIFOXYA12_FULL_61_11]
MEERNLLFKCLNCRKSFEINLGDFVTLKCPKCKTMPTPKMTKLFKETVQNIYQLEEEKEAFGFDFQYPSISIY